MTRLELPGEHDLVGIRAANPGPFTLTGTNSWIVGREPAWIVDPGPALPAHLDALAEEARRRGGLGGIALTHRHPDHDEAVPALRARFPGVPVAAAGGDAQVHLADGDRAGPLQALATAGHAPDHLSFLAGRVALCGDAVLGEGSVFVAPYPGALADYLDGLRRLRAREPALLCPGHGPVIVDPAGKIEEYLAHRLARERQLVAALQEGCRRIEDLLDRVWSDAPPSLRLAATVTLAAHLDKLEGEGRLPEGVERPAIPAWAASH
jgi:glyoxylase-like metal-dependent hydrolase (beta-lactamase superfamily II)